MMLRSLSILFIIAFVANTVNAEMIGVFYDHSIPQFEFAASDIKGALENNGFDVDLKPIAELSVTYGMKKVVISLKSNSSVIDLFVKEGGSRDKLGNLGEQAYALRTTELSQQTYWAIGGDIAGGLYGGLQIAENISFSSLDGTYNEEQAPYIKKRGIKFNIALDERVPTFASGGDQDKSNIKDMWDMEFWKEYLDDLARHRYNTLSYWTKHPFTTMIKLDEYPDVEVHDIIDGYGNFVKNMTIDEKITFWQEVMEYASHRSIDIFYITWNIYVNTAEGKYGITNESTNEKTKEYVRKCVKQFLLTYPHVDGIGVTAGEHMPDMTFNEREKWLWDTYALGIIDAKKEQPGREIRFIHRHWYSSCSDIMNHFQDFDGTFDFSFKYAKAHMYSSPNVTFEDFLLDEMPDGTKSWWNLRNDDIFYCRWGDPEYTRDFILNFDKEKTAGYLMGSDGYTWGRVYSSKDPAFQGKPEIKKHWYNFMLWGRLGYNPHLSATVFKNHIKLHFPEVSSEIMYDAWKTASMIIPQTTRFFWRDWDFQWYPEGCKGMQYLTVQDFMGGNTMEGSGILNIADYCTKVMNNELIMDTTPLDVANRLEGYARQTLLMIDGMNTSDNAELRLTKNDIMAFAHLGNYYSEKIRGATELSLYNFTSDPAHQNRAIGHLENALGHWKNYGNILDSQYLPRKYARTGMMDWNELTKEVAHDIELAKTIEKFTIDISFENMSEGAEYPKGIDLTVNVLVESTFNIARVGLKVNGEYVGMDAQAPYTWDAEKDAAFKNMNSGTYILEADVIDENGNKTEKSIQIKVK
jgi:hypothetical protein